MSLYVPHESKKHDTLLLPIMILWYHNIYNQIASDVWKKNNNPVDKLMIDNLQLVLINMLIRSIFEH